MCTLRLDSWPPHKFFLNEWMINEKNIVLKVKSYSSTILKTSKNIYIVYVKYIVDRQHILPSKHCLHLVDNRYL